ncbi:MAG TPA: hypothetical protein DDY37_01200, partial [Legionella sp.]|nr:hypothetical protein [Legionella sp.]
DNANEQFFLLHGDIGSGKSLSVLRLAQELAQQHWSADDWFPVYIKLKHVNDRSSDNFLDAALRTLFSLEQILVLKQTCRCVIILDGLDECGVDFSQRALLEECSDTAPQWAHGMPKIILTAQTRCIIDKNYHRLLRISPDIYFSRESEYAIQPLNDAQIESYLKSYDPSGIDIAALGTSLAGIKGIATSPLILHIMCVVLQETEERAMLPRSLEAFYDAFMHHWSKQVIPKRPMDHFTEESIRKYCRRIAFQMFVEQKNYIDRPYEEEAKEPLQLDEERRAAHLHLDPFTYLFEDTLWKKAGWLAPMSAKLLEDRLPRMVRYTFLHQSFQYKSLADELIDKLRGSETERLMNWNWSYLTDSLDVFDFLTRTINPSLQKKAMITALKEMVSASGAPGGHQWSPAASNAITLLNALQVDFSTLLRPFEWRGIHVPRAYLKGALMPSVDMPDSDLSDVMFGNDAVLAACNLRGSNVARARFSDTPLYAFTEKPPTFFTVIVLSDTWVVTYDGGKDADSKLHKIVNRGLDGTRYPDFSGHIDEIRAGVWGVSNGERRFASGGDGETVRVLRVLEKGGRGEEIAKLKDHLNGAILTLSWSKDGNILAAGGAYPCIRLWNVDQKKCDVVPAVHGGTVRAVLLGQIRDLMLSAGDDERVRLWTLSIRSRNVESLLNRPKEKRLPSPINTLALSVHEDAFAAGCSDSKVYLYATDHASFEHEAAPQVLQGHHDAVSAVIWNAWWLVSASNDSTVRVWDVKNRTCVSTFQGDGRPVKQLAWLPGGRHAIAGGGEKSRMLFIVDTDVRSSVLPDMDGLTHRVSCIAPYGKYLATGSIDGTVWLWDIKRLPVHTARKVLDHEGVPVIQIEWSQDGQYIASRSHRDVRIRERSFATDTEIDRSDRWGVIPFDNGIHFHHMTWLNDLDSKQSWLALAGSDGQIHLWKRKMTADVDEWAPLLFIPWGIERATLPIHCVAAAPSRRSILDAEIPSMSTLSSTHEPSGTALSLNDVNVFRSMSDKASPPVRLSDECIDSISPALPLSSGDISTSAGSNAATNMVAASVGPLIRIWDLRQEAGAVCVQECTGHTRTITQLTWSPDGRFLASMDEGERVWVWETSDWTCVFKDEQVVDEKHLSWAMIGEDKQWLVLGTYDAIRIFDTSLQFATREPVKHLSFGADKLCYHAGLLFLVQNRSVDMINFVELLLGERSSQSWVGRIGHGLCMQGCIATDVKNISQTTKAFIRNLGAVVSEDAVVPSWRFWEQRPAETATPFPALSPARAEFKPSTDRSPSVRMMGIFSEPRPRAASGSVDKQTDLHCL